tara:strand:- start:587 stop:1045 length:459 start_codon:yes stop_codon:yes gene_type:complete
MIKKSSRGFTLIELIVVVAIIGIISAVGTVAYQGYTKGAKESAVSSLVQQISLGQLEYYSNTGGYFISDGASTTTCNADRDTSAEIEDMIFGNADGTTDGDPNQIPDDIDFQFCTYGDEGISYTIEAQKTTGAAPRCVIRMSKNGSIQKENC